MASFSGVGSSGDYLRDEYEKLREVEDSKNALIERLFTQVDSLTSSLRESELLSQERNDLVRMYGQEKTEAKKAKEDIQKTITELSFIVVLVDGDAMPASYSTYAETPTDRLQFSDDLVKQKEQGGLEAARLLRQEALEHAQRNCDLLPGTRVLLRVYANLRGLAATYQHANVLQRSDDYLAFQRGFTMQNPLSDYVDVGDGKDRADEKLKELFRMSAADVHCKHIFFCASTDNGFARLLDQYPGNPSVCAKTTLVEGPPFGMEISKLTPYFHTVKFPSTFRPSKLPSRTPPPPPSPTSLSDNSTRTSITSSYATTTARNTAPSNHPLLPNTQTPTTPPPPPQRKITRNKRNQRLDPPRPTTVTEQDIYMIKKKKLCNWHHLQGGCFYKDCTHVHGEALDAKRTEALRCVARLGPCGRGLSCADFECIAGHACSRRGCDRVKCHFPPEMHNVDSVVAVQVSG